MSPPPGPKACAGWWREDFPEAERITLVMDNLNTHAGASLYKAFPAPKARRLLTKLQFVYTPRHGSWLNMAECEFSVLARQCLNRRLADRDTVKEEVTAWAKRRNDHGTTRPMAIHHRGRAHQIAQPVSKTITLMDY